MISIPEFQKKILSWYKKNGRHNLPWRKKTNQTTYRILVSELMLQQTQVDRVIPKYTAFLKKFPTAKSLSQASTSEVLKEWQGLKIAVQYYLVTVGFLIGLIVQWVFHT